MSRIENGKPQLSPYTRVVTQTEIPGADSNVALWRLCQRAFVRVNIIKDVKELPMGQGFLSDVDLPIGHWVSITYVVDRCYSALTSGRAIVFCSCNSVILTQVIFSPLGQTAVRASKPSIVNLTAGSIRTRP